MPQIESLRSQTIAACLSYLASNGQMLIMRKRLLAALPHRFLNEFGDFPIPIEGSIFNEAAQW